MATMPTRRCVGLRLGNAPITVGVQMLEHHTLAGGKLGMRDPTIAIAIQITGPAVPAMAVMTAPLAMTAPFSHLSRRQHAIVIGV
jgi:hypothetical protein